MKNVLCYLQIVVAVIVLCGYSQTSDITAEREVEPDSLFPGDTADVTLRLYSGGSADTTYTTQDILLSFDVSVSITRDSMLERAKEAAISFVEFSRGRYDDVRFSVFGFDHGMEEKTGYTSDLETVVDSIAALDKRVAPEDADYQDPYGDGPGTAISNAVHYSVEYAADSSNRKNPIIIVLTDAEDNITDDDDRREPPYNPQFENFEEAFDRSMEFHENTGGRVYSIILESNEYTEELRDISESTGAESFFAEDGDSLNAIYEEISYNIQDIAALSHIENGEPVPMVTDVVPKEFEVIENSVREGPGNTVEEPLQDYSVEANTDRTLLEFNIDTLYSGDVFEVQYSIVVPEGEGAVATSVTSDLDQSEYSHAEFSDFPGGEYVILEFPGNEVYLSKSPVKESFNISVYRALIEGVPENRYDTVSLNEGFSIVIDLVDSSGNRIDYSGYRELAFSWDSSSGTPDQPIPQTDNYLFENGSAIVKNGAYPFMVMNEGPEVLHVNDTIEDVNGSMRFYAEIYESDTIETENDYTDSVTVLTPFEPEQPFPGRYNDITSVPGGGVIRYRFHFSDSTDSEYIREIVESSSVDAEAEIFDCVGNSVIDCSGLDHNDTSIDMAYEVMDGDPVLLLFWSGKNSLGRDVAEGSYLVVLSGRGLNGERIHYESIIGVK